MREILFRGKHRDTGEWRYFNLFDTDMHYVEHDTIGQYTGLQDSSNIMRIYEGDILKDKSCNSIGTVEYYKGGFVVRTGGVCLALAQVNEYRKVIGNIHDGVMEG